MNSAVWFMTLKKFHTVGDFLIRSGVTVTRPVGRSRTCDPEATLLHIAARSGKLHRVKLLLEHGANPNAKDSQGKSVLHYAVDWDRAAVVDHLITIGADMNVRNKHNVTILHYAVQKEAEESIKVLLQRGVDVEAVDSRGWNSLQIAMMSNSAEIVEMLLDYKIPVNRRDVLSWTPLHFAAYHTHGEEISQLLLNHKANVNVKTKKGETPLHYAVKTNKLDVVKLLLKKGANINETTNDYETALHVACKKGLPCIADILLLNGADVNVRNKSGHVALSIVKPQTEHVTAKIVVKHIARLQLENAFINAGNMREIKNSDELYEYYNGCREELEIMKRTIVEENCRATYFYIISQDIKKVAALVRNKQLVRAFEESDYEDWLHIYAEDLKYKFDLAKETSKAIIAMEELLNDVVKSRLPYVTIQKIVGYIFKK